MSGRLMTTAPTTSTPTAIPAMAHPFVSDLRVPYADDRLLIDVLLPMTVLPLVTDAPERRCYQFLDGRHPLRNRRRDRISQADTFACVRGLATDHVDVARTTAQRAHVFQHRVGRHAVWVELPGVHVQRRSAAGIEDIHRSGRLTAGQRVHQDRDVIAMEQVIREMDATDSVVDHPHGVGHLHRGEAPSHLDTEPVVGEEDVADAGDQNLGSHDWIRSAVAPTMSAAVSGRSSSGAK